MVERRGIRRKNIISASGFRPDNSPVRPRALFSSATLNTTFQDSQKSVVAEHKPRDEHGRFVKSNIPQAGDQFSALLAELDKLKPLPTPEEDNQTKRTRAKSFYEKSFLKKALRILREKTEGLPDNNGVIHAYENWPLVYAWDPLPIKTITMTVGGGHVPIQRGVTIEVIHLGDKRISEDPTSTFDYDRCPAQYSIVVSWRLSPTEPKHFFLRFNENGNVTLFDKNGETTIPLNDLNNLTTAGNYLANAYQNAREGDWFLFGGARVFTPFHRPDSNETRSDQPVQAGVRFSALLNEFEQNAINEGSAVRLKEQREKDWRIAREATEAEELRTTNLIYEEWKTASGYYDQSQFPALLAVLHEKARVEVMRKRMHVSQRFRGTSWDYVFPRAQPALTNIITLYGYIPETSHVSVVSWTVPIGRVTNKEYGSYEREWKFFILEVDKNKNVSVYDGRGKTSALLDDLKYPSKAGDFLADAYQNASSGEWFTRPTPPPRPDPLQGDGWGGIG